MTRGALLLVLATIGCAAPARAPVIHVPEPCVCAAKRTDCDREIAVASAEAPPAPPWLHYNDPAFRARALLLVEVAVDDDLDNEGLPSRGRTELASLDPSIIAAEVSVAAEGPQQDMLRAIHELRELSSHDDATPAAERKILFWQRFEAEVANFRAAATEAIATRLADLLIDRTAVATTVHKVAAGVNRDFAPTADQRLAFARQRASLMLHELVEPVAREHSDALIAKRKGQWLAVLHGKT